MLSTLAIGTSDVPSATNSLLNPIRTSPNADHNPRTGTSFVITKKVRLLLQEFRHGAWEGRPTETDRLHNIGIDAGL